MTPDPHIRDHLGPSSLLHETTLRQIYEHSDDATVEPSNGSAKLASRPSDSGTLPEDRRRNPPTSISAGEGPLPRPSHPESQSPDAEIPSTSPATSANSTSETLAGPFATPRPALRHRVGRP